MPVDIWALGVLIYYSHTKKFPFKAADEAELLEMTTIDSTDFELVKNTQARRLIEIMLSPIPENRPKIGQVLNNSYFNTN